MRLMYVVLPLFVKLFTMATRKLCSNNTNIHCRDKQGNTLLHKAISRSRYEVAEFLIKEGSDVHADNVQGRTCLPLISFY